MGGGPSQGTPSPEDPPPCDSVLSLHRLGCGSLDYRELAQQVELKTGGLAAAPQVLPDDSHLNTYEQVTISSGAGWWGWFSPCLFFFFRRSEFFLPSWFRVCCSPLSASIET